MFQKLACFYIENSKKVTVAFIILTGFFAYMMLHLNVDFTPQKMFNKEDPDYKFYSTFIDAFGSDDSLLLVMIRGENIFSKKGTKMLNELTRAIESLPEVTDTRSLSNIPEIRSVGKDEISVAPLLDVSHLPVVDYNILQTRALKNRLFQRLYISTDGKVTAITTQLIDELTSAEDMKKVVEKIESILAEFSNQYPEFNILLGGIPYVRADMIRLLIKDQMRFMPVAAIVIMLISFLTFRSLNGVIIPVLTSLVIVIWGMGCIKLAGGEINVLTNAVPILIMIVGIADAIHIIVRFQEGIDNGLSRDEAVKSCVAHIGAACFYTSFTTAVAFASLAVSTNQLLRGFGIYAAISIMAAYLVTITFTPMVLKWWGRRSEVAQLNQGDSKSEPGFKRLSDVCISYRWPIFILGLCIFSISLIGAFRTRISNSLFEFYDKDSAVYESNLAIEESLAGVSSYVISFRGEKGLFKTPWFIARLMDLQEAIEKDPLVGKTLSVADIVFQMNDSFTGNAGSMGHPQLHQQDIEDYLFLAEEETERLVNKDFSWGIIDVRCKSVDSDVFSMHFKKTKDLIQTVFSDKTDDIQIDVTGISVFAYRSIDNSIKDMVESIFVACFIVFMIIALAFRSLQVALVSMIPNIIPVLFSYGIMGWLGVKLEMTTIIVFTIALGLAVDDSIHFLVRFREEFKKDGNHEDAVRRAFGGVGKAIVYTTVILVSGFLVLMISSLPPMVRFGLLTSATMMSALIADLFILPASILIFKPKF